MEENNTTDTVVQSTQKDNSDTDRITRLEQQLSTILNILSTRQDTTPVQEKIVWE